MGTPVNRPTPFPVPKADADERLYLRDLDLDQGAALVRAAARRLDQLTETTGQTGDASRADLCILLELHDFGDIDVSTLRQKLDWPRQTLARALDRLESGDLIGRRTAGADRRRRLVCLTPAGRSLAANASERRRAALRRAFLSAGPEAVNGARRVLNEILKAQDIP